MLRCCRSISAAAASFLCVGENIMKKKAKIIIAIIIILLAGIYYYVTLPAINIHASGFWLFVITSGSDRAGSIHSQEADVHAAGTEAQRYCQNTGEALPWCS